MPEHRTVSDYSPRFSFKISVCDFSQKAFKSGKVYLLWNIKVLLIQKIFLCWKTLYGTDQSFSTFDSNRNSYYIKFSKSKEKTI